MENRLYINESDIENMRHLISSLPNRPSTTDFEEFIQILTAQQTNRLWLQDSTLIAFAYVDDYNNLSFEIATEISNPNLEKKLEVLNRTKYQLQPLRIKYTKRSSNNMITRLKNYHKNRQRDTKKNALN